MSININDRVRVTVGSETDKVGEVVNIHKLSIDDIAIVKFQDETVKVPISALVKVESQEKKVVEEDLPEGAKRITKVEMFDALRVATDPSRFSDSDKAERMFFAYMGAVLTGTRIIAELYGDNDEIIILKVEFLEAIVRGVSVDKLSSDVDGQMTASQLMPISLLYMLLLKKMVPILFDDGSENA